MSKQISRQEIDRILFKLRDKLDFKERGHVKELLMEAPHGVVYQEDFHKKLLHLRAEYKIAEGHAVLIEAAVFGE